MQYCLNVRLCVFVFFFLPFLLLFLATKIVNKLNVIVRIITLTDSTALNRGRTDHLIVTFSSSQPNCGL